jgi:hypothetical protein
MTKYLHFERFVFEVLNDYSTAADNNIKSMLVKKYKYSIYHMLYKQHKYYHSQTSIIYIIRKIVLQAHCGGLAGVVWFDLWIIPS